MPSLFKYFNNPWKQHDPPKTFTITDKVVLIEQTQSLWYSTNGGRGENGMVEYDYNKNKIKQVVEYPQQIKPKWHSCCKFDNRIYIIDGDNGAIYLFNPSQNNLIN